MGKESSEPFTSDEVRLIIEEANALGPDPEHLCLFLLHFGIHPCLVQELSGEDVKLHRLDGRDAFYLPWGRAKTGAVVRFPVMEEDLPWIVEFLDRTPFGSRWSIDRQLTRIQSRLEKRGYSINVCARRFRHTCAVFLLQRGFPEVLVRILLRVTPKTLETYGKYRFETVYTMLRDSQWGSYLGPPPQFSGTVAKPVE